MLHLLATENLPGRKALRNQLVHIRRCPPRLTISPECPPANRPHVLCVACGLQHCEHQSCPSTLLSSSVTLCVLCALCVKSFSLSAHNSGIARLCDDPSQARPITRNHWPPIHDRQRPNPHKRTQRQLVLPRNRPS